MLLFLSIIENVCHGIHQYESTHANFKEFLYFSLFSSVTSAALNTIHISYGISYFRHRDSSDIFTYDIARQSVVDKMVREISLEVREKSGKSQGKVREFCFHILVGTLPVQKLLKQTFSHHSHPHPWNLNLHAGSYQGIPQGERIFWSGCPEARYISETILSGGLRI